MKLLVKEEDAGNRLDQLLRSSLPEYSRVAIQRAIHQGLCLINGRIEKNADCRPNPGQLIEIEMPALNSGLKPESGDAPIVWNDNWLLVCNKPAGVSVHPCPSCQENTLCQRLLHRFPILAKMGGERPGIVHRLDKDTSGLIIVALTEKSRLALVDAFAARQIQKEYLALVAGKPPQSGECKEPIGRHETCRTKMAIRPLNRGGKPAYTTWRTLLYFPTGDFSLLAIRIHTGRTHQIRVHMSHLGYPLLGDKTYAPVKCAERAPRQMLHAWRLDFTHPLTGEVLQFCVPPPEDFYETVSKNVRKAPLVVITGNQGCGKSTFTKMLGEYGLPAISADAIVADLYKNAGPVAKWLKSHGRSQCLGKDGSVSKSALFEAINAEPGLREELEQFVHLLVYAKINEFYNEYAASDVCAVLAEIPLYFESEGPDKFPQKPFVIGIHCEENKRWQRIAQTRGWPQDKIRALEAWQWVESRKMAACDYVVDNSSDEESLKKSVDHVYSQLCKFADDQASKILESVKKICACG